MPKVNISKHYSRIVTQICLLTRISSGSAATDFTIWNANATYRFFKGNNLELKFSALDLLHQNTSIINYGNNNNITHGTVNVLQKYFMLSVSYFPRKFGKKKSNNDD